MQWCFFCAVWSGLERPDQPARQACAMFINQQNKVTVPFCRLPTNYHLHTHLSTELTYFPRPNLHYSFLTELGCRKMLKGDKQFLHHCKQKSKKKKKTHETFQLQIQKNEGSFTWVFRLSWQMLFLKWLFSLTKRKSSVRMHTHCRLLSRYQHSSSCSQRHTCSSISADNAFHLPIHLDRTILDSQCLHSSYAQLNSPWRWEKGTNR